LVNFRRFIVKPQEENKACGITAEIKKNYIDTPIKTNNGLERPEDI